MMNRHGLVAGATGTGKTKTLQGCGRAAVGGRSAGVRRRREGRRLRVWPRPARPAARPRSGCRTSASRSSPQASRSSSCRSAASARACPYAPPSPTSARSCSRKVLDANETQEQSLGAGVPLRRREGPAAARPLRPARPADVSRVRRGQGRAGGDRRAFARRRSACCCARWSGSRTAAATSSSASRSSKSPTCIRTAPDGRGVISCLELPAVQDKPALFSTALMWLVAELFEELPEVGDLDKPKLVFFFDEAHLLFDGATEGLPRLGRADRAADPLEGRRGVLRHPDPEGRARRRARPARQPRPARAARVHPATTRRR